MWFGKRLERGFSRVSSWFQAVSSWIRAGGGIGIGKVRWQNSRRLTQPFRPPCSSCCCSCFCFCCFCFCWCITSPISKIQWKPISNDRRLKWLFSIFKSVKIEAKSKEQVSFCGRYPPGYLCSAFYWQTGEGRGVLESNKKGCQPTWEKFKIGERSSFYFTFT